ncbi:hypothetical protein WJX74_001987 [Apatococcus lobatus]|uniref:ABC transporter domain-containing protein n=1 Tax=Apatococcus lobatus TaxID=904363 RepID=A0AAW1RS38_9CHLO
MKPGSEDAPVDGPRQGVGSLADTASFKSIRAALRKPRLPQQQEEQMNDTNQLIQAALEEVPESIRSMHVVLKKGNEEQEAVGYEVINLLKMSKTQMQDVVDSALGTSGQSNEEFQRKFHERVQRAGIHLPTIEIKFKGITVDAEVYKGNRALPTITNSYRNMIEGVLSSLRIYKGNKVPFGILKDISGVIRPGRLTLLLGPPGAGKTTLLKALAGKLRHNHSLKLQGDITYNDEPFSNFYPERTAAYVDQIDEHIAELTVRETFDFAARCQGTALRQKLLQHLEAREKEGGIKPDAALDAYQKANSIPGQRSSPSTQYLMRLLGLEICQDTLVGNNMTRGNSGGQKKRMTTGEMMVGAKVTFFLDEISTGLDSSTTYLIVKSLQNLVHLQQATIFMALLQPQPETYELADDIFLLAEGHTVYHGPREEIMDFFNSVGFRLPTRKDPASFLQEVTSVKDQQQFWADASQPHQFVPVMTFAKAFKKTKLGQGWAEALSTPFQRPEGFIDDLNPLQRSMYGLKAWPAFRACFRREFTLVLRHRFIYIFRTTQVAVLAFVTGTLFVRTRNPTNTVTDGGKFANLLFFSLLTMQFDAFTEMSITLNGLNIFYKQRDNLFFPTWAYALPVTVLRIPYSLVSSFLFSGLVYYVAGLDPNPGRFFTYWCLLFLTHQFAIALFRLIGTIGRTLVVSYTLAWLIFIIVLLLDGFVLIKRSVPDWFIGGYWALPLSYLTDGIEINEFSGERWKKPAPSNPGKSLMVAVEDQFSFRHLRAWIWIGMAVAIAWIIGLNILIFFSLEILNPFEAGDNSMPEDALAEREATRVGTRAPHNGLRSSDPNAEQARAAEEGRADDINEFIKTGRTGNRTGLEQIDEEQVEHRCWHHGPAWGTIVSSGTSQPVPPSPKDANSVPFKRALLAAAAPGIGKARRRKAEGESGMVLPFEPFNMTFHHVEYFVDLPSGMNADRGIHFEGIRRQQLQLLTNISGSFRPGILCALMGTSGAGKTTLMDVLAGRKTSGIIKGEIKLEGHDKEQGPFARVSGYVEQADVHSPATTILEALYFSACCRLMGVNQAQLRQFVDQVLELMELVVLRNSVVGLPGINGLSVEQRKRLTIGVELVANPSIIFMDEPTSGLDARAAAVVMQTVRNAVNTGRTVVCTIHQPSIEIFETFDELLLLKRGGKVIYNGPTGQQSADLVRYFEGIEGVPKLQAGISPATWMLDISTVSAEERLGRDFADVYCESDLFRRTEALIERHKIPKEGSKPLHFDNACSQNFWNQLRMLLWKNHLIYWRTPQYNGVKMAFAIIFGLLVGAIFWRLGASRGDALAVQNVAGALLVADFFMGTNNASTVQPIVEVERAVMYRERASGYYATYPFALAQTLIELPYLLVQTILYVTITYFMIYFEINPAKFFWYLLITFLTLTFFTMYGQMAVAVSRDTQMAAVLSESFYTLWFLFGGYIIGRPQIPGWWIWYYWLDPLTYTIYGLVASQLGDLSDASNPSHLIVTLEGKTVTISAYLQEIYGFHHDFVGYCVLVLIGFIVMFHTVSAAAHARFNFQTK